MAGIPVPRSADCAPVVAVPVRLRSRGVDRLLLVGRLRGGLVRGPPCHVSTAAGDGAPWGAAAAAVPQSMEPGPAPGAAGVRCQGSGASA